MNSHIQKLIATLKQLPPEWLLVPSRYKRPLGYFWQEKPFTPRQLIQGLLAGGITVVNKDQQPYQVLRTGFGLLTGYPLKAGDQTYYLMALDQDGLSAAAKILELSQGAKLPHTVAFTSGRSFRCQYLFAISADDASQLETRKINTGKDEALELRWKGCQSILPPSLHPTNGQYPAKSAIVTAAHQINSGQYPTIELISDNPRSDCLWHGGGYQPEHGVQVICELIADLIPQLGFNRATDVQVLCPMTRGVVGTRNLNRVLQELINPPAPDKVELVRGGSTIRVGDRA